MTGEQLTLDNIILKDGTFLCEQEKLNKTKNGIIVPDSVTSLEGLTKVVKSNHSIICENDYIALYTAQYPAYQIGNKWYMVLTIEDVAYIARLPL